MMNQAELFHDTFEDALRTVVDAIGGPKKAAARLWPNKLIADAQRLLLHCLDPERAEKLTPHEIGVLIGWGREAGCHSPMIYLARQCGYEDPKPIDPQTEQERLQRDFVKSVEQLSKIASRLGVKLSDVIPLRGAA